jgi:hypothetical protein
MKCSSVKAEPEFLAGELRPAHEVGEVDVTECQADAASAGGAFRLRRRSLRWQ